MLPGTAASLPSAPHPGWRGGERRREHGSVYKSALEQTQAGCEKRFRSIKFPPLTRCQNIPQGPRPGRPRGAPSPPRRRARLPRSASNFLPTAICLGGGSRGETKRRRPGGERRPCHAEAARPPAEPGKLAQLLRSRARGSGALPPPPFPEGWFGPGDLRLAAEAVRVVRERPLSAPPLTLGPGARHRARWRRPCTRAGCDPPSPVGPAPGSTRWAARRSCCQAIQARPPAPAGELNENSPTV